VTLIPTAAIVRDVPAKRTADRGFPPPVGVESPWTEMRRSMPSCTEHKEICVEFACLDAWLLGLRDDI
jgi:hypothetical protein